MHIQTHTHTLSLSLSLSVSLSLSLSLSLSVLIQAVQAVPRLEMKYKTELETSYGVKFDSPPALLVREDATVWTTCTESYLQEDTTMSNVCKAAAQEALGMELPY